MLSDIELQLLKRHFEIQGWDISKQEALKNSSVFVAGAGGLGSPVLFYLAAAGIGNIKFCDRDVVDLSNLNRQILYTISDSGKPKAHIARERLLQLNSFAKIQSLKGEINESLFEGEHFDLIIDCVDNFETRHLLNKISIKKNIPLLHAGVTEFYCQVTLLIPGQTPCLACFLPEGTKNSGKGIIGAMAGIAGSIQALEAIKFLSKTGESLVGKILFVDMKNISFNTMNIKVNPKCKICSHLAR